MYREIVFQCWSGEYISEVRGALQAVPRRARMVGRFAIRSTHSCIEQLACDDLIEILKVVPNLKTLELRIFDPKRLTSLSRVLDALGNEMFPFRLQHLITDAPYGAEQAGHAIVNLCTTQPEIYFLNWNDMHLDGGMRPPRTPADALPALKYLSCQIGLWPFAPSARSITHLEVGFRPQPQIDGILRIFANQLVSLKLVERREDSYTRVEPSVMFRYGLPKTLRYLEIRELQKFYFVSDQCRSPEDQASCHAPGTPQCTIHEGRHLLCHTLHDARAHARDHRVGGDLDAAERSLGRTDASVCASRQGGVSLVQAVRRSRRVRPAIAIRGPTQW